MHELATGWTNHTGEMTGVAEFLAGGKDAEFEYA